MWKLVLPAALLSTALGSAAAAAQPNPFGAQALDDHALAAINARYASPGFARNARASVDQGTRLYFDTTAAVGRVTFDNWFAREGADLISAGALGRPLVLD